MRGASPAPRTLAASPLSKLCRSRRIHAVTECRKCGAATSRGDMIAYYKRAGAVECHPCATA
jgi:hypothetical protein